MSDVFILWPRPIVMTFRVGPSLPLGKVWVLPGSPGTKGIPMGIGVVSTSHPLPLSIAATPVPEGLELMGWLGWCVLVGWPGAGSRTGVCLSGVGGC